MANDSLSRLFIMDSVNISLCPDEQDECIYKQQVYDVVFTWIHQLAKKHYVWVEKPIEVKEKFVPKTKRLNKSLDKAMRDFLNRDKTNENKVDRTTKVKFGKIKRITSASFDKAKPDSTKTKKNKINWENR